MESKGAVLIEGPKWCGKTTSGKHFAKSFIEMNRLDMTEQYQQMARLKPSALLEGDVPHLIDEWQIAPEIWNAVRYEVDQRGAFGQFILTGSSVPPILDESIHTGTSCGAIKKAILFLKCVTIAIDWNIKKDVLKVLY